MKSSHRILFILICSFSALPTGQPTFPVEAHPSVSLSTIMQGHARARIVQLTTAQRKDILASIKNYMEEQERAGLSGVVLLAKDDEIVFNKGYGFADRERGRRVTPDTGFDLGSIVKLFTGVAILKLEAQGKLKTSDHLSKFFPNAPPDKAAITIHQLLNHTSGLPDLVDKGSNPLPNDDSVTDFNLETVTREELVRRALKAKLLFPPGVKTEYSNLGYSILGVVIEVASGQPYEEYLHRQIFKPAGMRKTGYLKPGWGRKGLAVGYLQGKPVGTPLDYTYLQDGPTWNLRAAGGMMSTAGDMHRWVQALKGERMLPKDAREKFFDFYVPRNSNPRRLAFLGGNSTFTAVFRFYLDEGSLIVALTNVDQFPANKLMGELSKQMLSLKKR